MKWQEKTAFVSRDVRLYLTCDDAENLIKEFGFNNVSAKQLCFEINNIIDYGAVSRSLLAYKPNKKDRKSLLEYLFKNSEQLLNGIKILKYYGFETIDLLKSNENNIYPFIDSFVKQLRQFNNRVKMGLWLLDSEREKAINAKKSQLEDDKKFIKENPDMPDISVINYAINHQEKLKTLIHQHQKNRQ